MKSLNLKGFVLNDKLKILKQPKIVENENEAMLEEFSKAYSVTK